MATKKTEMAVKKDTAVGEAKDWAAELAQYAKEGSKGERPSASYISLKSGILSYSGTPIPDNKLECIVIDSAYEHTWYGDQAYDPNALRTPYCFSLSKEEEGLGPHEMAVKPQGGDDNDCATCAMNKWGSDPKGGRGKACQERRRLLIIPKDLATADDVLAAEVAVMKLPVTSVKLWAQYVNTLDAMYKRPSFAMITEISTVPDAKSQFKVNFKPVEQVDLELMTAIMQKREMSEGVLLKPYEQQEEADKPAVKGDTKYAG